MAETGVLLNRRELTTPRSAAIAGIIFSVLFGTSILLIRLSVPTDPATGSVWLETSSRVLILALNLIPYAGIAFLWFIGVIRDRIGSLEDRFFATVFLGSGLLFLGMTFVSAATASALVNSYALNTAIAQDSGVFIYNRAIMNHLMNIYAIRMAGVFMMSLGTIWLRTGLMRRSWAFVTYALALVLLVSISFSLWVTLIFPGWVLAVSIYIMIENKPIKSTDLMGNMREA